MIPNEVSPIQLDKVVSKWIAYITLVAAIVACVSGGCIVHDIATLKAAQTAQCTAISDLSTQISGVSTDLGKINKTVSGIATTVGAVRQSQTDAAAAKREAEREAAIEQKFREKYGYPQQGGYLPPQGDNVTAQNAPTPTPKGGKNT